MKLIGSIDGIEVVFDFYPPKYFRGVIPKQLDGQYIMQLKVIDDYGNESGGVYKYMYVDFSSLHFHILGENFKFTQEDEDKSFIKVENLYNHAIIKDGYSCNEVCSKYSYKELMNRCICS